MARSAFAVALFLYFFAFSSARISLNLQSNEVTGQVLPDSAPGSDAVTSSVILPDVVQSDIQIANEKPAKFETESKPVKADSDLPELDAKNPEFIPLTIVRFRPVNRHFRPYPFHSRSYPFHSRRGCGHGKRPPHLSYGNDMILAGENRNFEPFRGGDHRMPENWIGFHEHRHHHHRHHDDDDDMPFWHHHERPGKNRDGHDKGERKNEEDEREEGGMFRRFRKFLDF